MANMEGNDKVISGKKFLPIFGIGILVFMVVGIAVTWGIGQLALPLFEKKSKSTAPFSTERPAPPAGETR